MSDPTEQLIELMLSLKVHKLFSLNTKTIFTHPHQKTTPSDARNILNSTPPQIAQSLIKLMVSMDAVNFDVFQVPSFLKFAEQNS